MGLSIVHGRILFEHGKGEESIQYLQSLGEDEHYPCISSSMFSINTKKRPQYYEQQVVAFGATYKNIEYLYDFQVFILKLEKLLRNLQFDTMHMHLTTEVTGSYDFFWKKIDEIDAIKEEYETEDFQLIKTNEWYFGYGYRNDLGALEVPLKKEHIFSLFDFSYPVCISKTLQEHVMPLLKGIKEANLYSKIYVNDYLEGALFKEEEVYFMLSKLQLEDKIQFNFEGKYGYSVIKLKELEEVLS